MKTYAPPKLRQIVTEAVFRRKHIFVVTVCVVVGLAAIATLLMHKKYKSQAKLMVQNVRSLTPLSTNPNDRQVSQSDVSQEEINSEVDLLQSGGVARHALQDQIAGLKTSDQDSKISNLQHRMIVEAVHQTSLINISLIANSPEDADVQLRKVLDSYFEVRAGTARSSGAADFFNKQVDKQSSIVDANQKALTDFEVAHGIADLDDQKKLQVQRIAGLQDQLTTADTTLARQISLRDAEKNQLSLTPQRTRTTERTITNQYSQERFLTALVDLENRRSELLKRYVPTDRQVTEVEEKIATTRKAMATATSQPAGEQATDVNPTYQQLSTALVQSGTEVHGTTAQRSEVMAQLDAARKRMNELNEATSEFDSLKRKVQQSQADYTLYAQRRDEAHIAEELDKAKMFDVSLVQAPVSSAEAVRPKPVLYIGVALAFGILLGIALALYNDTSAEQVYTPTQLDALTGTRTIATFATEGDANVPADTNRLEYRRILFALRNALSPRLAEEDGTRTVSLEAANINPSDIPAGYCVAFTAATNGEGVSHLVSNLAQEASRQASSRVAVLDMGGLLRQFEAEEDLTFALRYLPDKQYWVLTFAKEHPGAVDPFRHAAAQGQFSARMCPLLIDARKEFDFLFLDCPSFAESTLASELDICVDGYVAIVSAGKARKSNLEQMSAVLRESRAPLLGYVLNRRQYPVPNWMHRLLW